MNLSTQIFLKLYLTIVMSVILIGILVEVIWQSSEQLPDNTPPQFEKTLSIASLWLNQQKNAPSNKLIEELNQQTSTEFFLLNLADVEASSLFKQLKEKKIITLQDKEGSLTAYQLLNDQQTILALKIDTAKSSDSYKTFWLALFYFLIALIVYFWIRPLGRDLKSLEKAAINFSKKQWDTQITLPNSSPVSNLAQAYQSLLNRIKQLLNAQKEMSHAISHELRTPLARIKFSIEMAQTSTSIEKIKAHILSISEDISEIHQLVDELLSYAALEKDSTKANIEKGDIKSLINNLTGKLGPLLNPLDINETFIGTETTVYCDSYLIERAIQNLLINASHYAKSMIKVTTEITDEQVLIIIEDDGPGISKEYQSKIFDSFFRMENNTKKGFGLGLAIVRRIATLHQGEVEATDSQLGGAKFTLRWPQKVA